MQMFLRTLLVVYLGHLAADFVFQTRRLVDEKRQGKPSAYFLHGLIHYLCTIAIVGFFVPGSIAAFSTHLVIIALALVHLVIDFVKLQLAARGLVRDGARAYALDQLIHFLTVIFSAWLLTPGMSFAALAAPMEKRPRCWEQISRRAGHLHWRHFWRRLLDPLFYAFPGRKCQG